MSSFMNVAQFFSLAYWFELNPVADFVYLRLLTGVVIGLFVAGIVIQLIARFGKMNAVVRKFLRRLPGPMYLTSIIAAFFLFARSQRAAYLGMRFFLLITFGLFIVWLVVAIVKFIRNYRREVNAAEKRKENKKAKRRLQR
jgi:hypothetical protein